MMLRLLHRHGWDDSDPAQPFGQPTPAGKKKDVPKRQIALRGTAELL